MDKFSILVINDILNKPIELTKNATGKFSGNIKIPNAEATLNTSDLYTQGSELKRNAIEGLKERLKALDPSEQMRKQAEMSEQLNKILSYKPMGIFVK